MILYYISTLFLPPFFVFLPSFVVHETKCGGGRCFKILGMEKFSRRIYLVARVSC